MKPKFRMSLAELLEECDWGLERESGVVEGEKAWLEG